MVTFVEVVGRHDGPRLAFLYGGLEGGEVDFVQRAVVYNDVGVVAVHFVVIQCEMLHAGSHAVALQSLDVGHHHAARQVGVFTHVLKVAAVERRAVDVDTGAQQHVLLAEAGFFAHALAVKEGHLGIPRGGKAGQCRESHARVVGPPGLVPLVPQHFGAHAVGAVVGPHFVDAQAGHAGTAELGLRMDNFDFLLQGHTLQGVFHPLLKGFGFV